MTALTCVTWNIHRAVGTDGRCDPQRVVDAIESVLVPHVPDILAMQEADTDCPPHASIIDIDRVSRVTSLAYQHSDARLRWGPQSDGFLGTILWVHPRFEPVHADVIDLPGHCHRGVISLECQGLNGPFRVMSGHFSLTQILRIAQMRILGQYLSRRPKMQTILLGDLNEWRPWGGMALSQRVLGARFSGPALRTFPSRHPLLPLDRILSNRTDAVFDAQVLRHAETDAASDHCPLLAKVSLQSDCR